MSGDIAPSSPSIVGDVGAGTLTPNTLSLYPEILAAITQAVQAAIAAQGEKSLPKHSSGTTPT